MISVQPYLRAVAGATALGGLISSLELLRISEAFRDEGPLSWKIGGSLTRRRPLIRVLTRVCRGVFGWPSVVGLILARAVSALACVLYAIVGPVPAPILAIFVVTGFLLFTLRAPDLVDGGEQMMAIAGTACLLAALSGSEASGRISLFFLAGQLSLSYGTAGMVKIGEPGWRSGVFLTEIFSTGTFGRPAIYRLVSQTPSLARWASRTAVVAELVWAFAPWCPHRISMFLLAGSASFHLANALIMGLNTYTIAFLAVFPAAIFSSRTIFG